MVKIVNLTPHPINIIGFGEIKPNGKPVRLEENIDVVGSIHISAIENPFFNGEVKIPIIQKKMGKIIDLPKPQDDTVFVVSLPVAQAARRGDVLAIGESVRDEKGRVTGAKSLSMVV